MLLFRRRSFETRFTFVGCVEYIYFDKYSTVSRLKLIRMMLEYRSVVLLALCLHSVGSCGCYGSTSCTNRGVQCNGSRNDSCQCDCCSPCNTCEQFLHFRCLAYRYLSRLRFVSYASRILLRVNETMPSHYLLDEGNGQLARYLWDPCVNRSLPNGIELTHDENQTYRLTGEPMQRQDETSYELLFKGSVSEILRMEFTIAVHG